MQERQIEYVEAGKLEPYEANARTHSKEQIEQIAASIKEFGFTNPILINERNGIIAGHGRVEAAGTLNIDLLPCIRLTGLSDAQELALIIADNKIALNAGWDDDVLTAELRALGEMEFDIGVLGFDDSELAHMFRTIEGATDPDTAPEPPAVPVSIQGDIWILGDHRLACGSSTDPDTVQAVLGKDKPHLMVTDPPYGVEYEAGWRSKAMPAKNDPNRWVDGAGCPTGRVENDDNADWSEAWGLFSGDVAYVWHAGNMAHIVAESLIGTGLDIRAQIIWNKQQLVIGRGDYHPKHEPCWYAVRKGRKGHWQGSRKETTIWEIDKPQKSETGHSTQKPIECMKRPIENNSKAGDLVYEPFSGSGTTIIACEMTGRRCRAIELNPAYIDVAVIRWQDFAEADAIHAETGKTFAEMTELRGAAA